MWRRCWKRERDGSPLGVWIGSFCVVCYSFPIIFVSLHFCTFLLIYFILFSLHHLLDNLCDYRDIFTNSLREICLVCFYPLLFYSSLFSRFPPRNLSSIIFHCKTVREPLSLLGCIHLFTHNHFFFFVIFIYTYFFSVLPILSGDT